MLQGCPKEKVKTDCYLNNIIVHGAIKAAPATDSLPLGDTLYLSSAIPRNVFDNNNQPVNLEGKGVNTKFEIRRILSLTGMSQSDVNFFSLSGIIGDVNTSGHTLHAMFNYTAVADSMKMVAGVVFTKKGIYQVTGTNSTVALSGLRINSFFYPTGDCYQGLLTDTFSNPNRHWNLYGLPTYNLPSSYFVKIY